MDTEFYTKVFVNTASAHDALLRQVAAILGGDIEMWTVVAGDVVADVRPNDDASSADVQRDAADFIHYPYTVEVVGEGLGLDDYISRVSSVMSGLHSAGADVVAACDWEEQLPGKGTLVSSPSRR